MQSPYFFLVVSFVIGLNFIEGVSCHAVDVLTRVRGWKYQFMYQSLHIPVVRGDWQTGTRRLRRELGLGQRWLYKRRQSVASGAFASPARPTGNDFGATGTGTCGSSDRHSLCKRNSRFASKSSSRQIEWHTPGSHVCAAALDLNAIGKFVRRPDFVEANDAITAFTKEIAGTTVAWSRYFVQTVLAELPPA